MPDWEQTRASFQSKTSRLLIFGKAHKLQLFCLAVVHTEELITCKSHKEKCNSKLIELYTISF
jgi:hypothetical protein